MEKDTAAQSTPVSPVQPTPAPATVSSPPSSLPSPAIPTLDLKAALKIETAAPVEEEKENKYGKGLYILGFVFCALLILAVCFVAYFWTQTGNQTQKITTVESTSK